MSSHDIRGREYARLSELKAGDMIQAAEDFGCIKADAFLLVKENEYGLYIDCDKGGHHLEGHLPFDDDADDHLVGIYPIIITLENPT
jgi:hypothetical protein